MVSPPTWPGASVGVDARLDRVPPVVRPRRAYHRPVDADALRRRRRTVGPHHARAPQRGCTGVVAAATVDPRAPSAAIAAGVDAVLSFSQRPRGRPGVVIDVRDAGGRPRRPDAVARVAARHVRRHRRPSVRRPPADEPPARSPRPRSLPELAVAVAGRPSTSVPTRLARPPGRRAAWSRRGPPRAVQRAAADAAVELAAPASVDRPGRSRDPWSQPRPASASTSALDGGRRRGAERTDRPTRCPRGPWPRRSRGHTLAPCSPRRRALIGPTGAPRRPGHPGLRPQRGRLRGARRPARGRGWRLVDRGRPTPTSWWSTPAGSSTRPRRTRSTPCSPPPTEGPGAKVGRRRLPGRAVRRRAGREPARGRRGARLRRLRGHRRAARRRARRARARARTSPRDRRTLLPITPVQRARRGGRVAVPGHALGARPAGGRGSRARRPVGPAEDRLGLRPALHVLRDPVVPRRVRLPPAARDPRRGRVAGRAGRPRARAGQRELHLLRQGPAATCGCSRSCCRSWPRSPASSGCACPTCSRPRPART